MGRCKAITEKGGFGYCCSPAEGNIFLAQSRRRSCRRKPNGRRRRNRWSSSQSMWRRSPSRVYYMMLTRVFAGGYKDLPSTRPIFFRCCACNTCRTSEYPPSYYGGYCYTRNFGYYVRRVSFMIFFD